MVPFHKTKCLYTRIDYHGRKGVLLQSYGAPDRHLPNTHIGMDPYAIRPIPRFCPIPPGQPALVGGTIQVNPIYALWKDGRQIIIQACTTLEHPIPGFDPFAPGAQDLISSLKQMYASYLEIIVSCEVRDHQDEH